MTLPTNTPPASAVTVMLLPDLVMTQAKHALHSFYSIHTHVDPSHGAPHALRVLHHAENAIAATQEGMNTLRCLPYILFLSYTS